MASIAEIFTPEQIEILLTWYRANRRELPWRQTRDPYRIWISEIMLQQTRVEAVKPYYARFLESCPTVAALAELPTERLLKLWEGLGYYSRARNLQKAAQTVLREHNGQLPTSYEALRRLCGIGDYTAGAIASIAFGIRVPAVDGNVLRVLSRLQGAYDDITLQATKNAWREKLGKVVPADAGDFTQALIELGAVVCVPNGEAKCAICPMATVCAAAKEGLCDELPVKAAKKPRRIEKRTVLLIRDDNRTAIGRRPDRGLLAGLFELPNTEGHLDGEALTDYVRSLGFDPLHFERLEDSKHVFTHIEWQMIAYAVKISPEFDGCRSTPGPELVKNEDLHLHYAIPSAFAAYRKYL